MARKPGVISGAVCGPRGTPVAEARVTFTRGPVSLPDIAALTDAQGRFVLSAPGPGNYEIECMADGCTPARVAVEVAEGQTVEVRIQLKGTLPAQGSMKSEL